MIRKRLVPPAPRKGDGHSQLEQFEQVIADTQARSTERMGAIIARLAALEEEQQSLLTLRRRLAAAALEQ